MKKNDLVHRKGRVTVSRELLNTLDPEVLKEIFSIFFPYHIDQHHNFDPFGATYFGFCAQFDKVESGEKIPEYEFLIHTKDDKFESLTVKKSRWTEDHFSKA